MFSTPLLQIFLWNSSNLLALKLKPSRTWEGRVWRLESRCPLVMAPTTYPYLLGFLRVQVALEGQETLMGKVSNQNMKGHLSEVWTVPDVRNIGPPGQRSPSPWMERCGYVGPHKPTFYSSSSLYYLFFSSLFFLKSLPTPFRPM